MSAAGPSTYVALLRGVNVGGANRLAMADLRATAEACGLGEPRTLLQSGNLVFRSDGETSEALERRPQAALSVRLGITVEIVVRTANAWRAIVAANPFADTATGDPSHLVVVAAKSAPLADAERRLTAAIVGPEVAHVIGREAFIHYPAGIGPSKLTAAVIDRALGAPSTARNWNTVLKLAAML